MRSMIAVPFALVIATGAANAQVSLHPADRRDSASTSSLPPVEIYLAAHEFTIAVDSQTGENVLGSTTFYFADPSCSEGTFSGLARTLLRPNVDVNDVYITTSKQGTEVTAVTHSRWPFPGIGDPCSPSVDEPEFAVPATQVDPAADIRLSLPPLLPLDVEQPGEPRSHCC
jgi:hypothetical protein